MNKIPIEIAVSLFAMTFSNEHRKTAKAGSLMQAYWTIIYFGSLILIGLTICDICSSYL